MPAIRESQPCQPHPQLRSSSIQSPQASRRLLTRVLRQKTLLMLQNGCQTPWLSFCRALKCAMIQLNLRHWRGAKWPAPYWKIWFCAAMAVAIQRGLVCMSAGEHELCSRCDTCYKGPSNAGREIITGRVQLQGVEKHRARPPARVLRRGLRSRAQFPLRAPKTGGWQDWAPRLA